MLQSMRALLCGNAHVMCARQSDSSTFVLEHVLVSRVSVGKLHGCWVWLNVCPYADADDVHVHFATCMCLCMGKECICKHPCIYNDASVFPAKADCSTYMCMNFSSGSLMEQCYGRAGCVKSHYSHTHVMLSMPLIRWVEIFFSSRELNAT